MMLLILPCHKARALFIMWPFNVGIYAKHPPYTHGVSETVCVRVQCGVIIYNTLRLNEAISHNAYSLTWWAGLGWAVVMSAHPLQIYSER